MYSGCSAGAQETYRPLPGHVRMQGIRAGDLGGKGELQVNDYRCIRRRITITFQFACQLTGRPANNPVGQNNYGERDPGASRTAPPCNMGYQESV